MEPGHHGLEHQTDVHPRLRLSAPDEPPAQKKPRNQEIFLAVPIAFTLNRETSARQAASSLSDLTHRLDIG